MLSLILICDNCYIAIFYLLILLSITYWLRYLSLIYLFILFIIYLFIYLSYVLVDVIMWYIGSNQSINHLSFICLLLIIDYWLYWFYMILFVNYYLICATLCAIFMAYLLTFALISLALLFFVNYWHCACYTSLGWVAVVMTDYLFIYLFWLIDLLLAYSWPSGMHSLCFRRCHCIIFIKLGPVSVSYGLLIVARGFILSDLESYVILFFAMIYFAIIIIVLLFLEVMSGSDSLYSSRRVAMSYAFYRCSLWLISSSDWWRL